MKYPDPDYFEPPEARSIVAAAKARHPRRGAAVMVLFETGARIGSLAGVEPRDIRGNPPARMAFRITKGDRPYSASLSPAASQAVVELLGMMEPEQDTLVGVSSMQIGNWFHEAALDAGFPPGRIHAHLARHTAGTLFYRRTKDPMALRKFLNHADGSQAQRYVRTLDEEVAAHLEVPLIG